jgi:hypothetical protein
MRNRSLVSLLAIAALGAACSTVIGIEEVHEGPDPEGQSGSSSSGKGGASGSGQGGSASGQGGTAGSAGKAAGGSAGNAAGNGGAAGAQAGRAGSGGQVSGGSGGSGGDSGQAGEATSAGSGGGPQDKTVRGKVVSYWLQPIEGVTVSIGDASAETDDDGEFEIPDVADTYDAKFVVNYQRNNAPASYGWVYEGLTRRDPTLQVYGGLDDKSGQIFIDPSDFDADNQVLTVAVASEYGDSEHPEISSAAGVHTSSTWNGPDDVGGRAHALLYSVDDNDLPTAYFSYTSEPVTLTTSGEANIYLDLSEGPVDSATISGTVTSPSSTDRENRVYVRFANHASLPLVWDYSDGVDSFSYIVPSIGDAQISVSAAEGTAAFGQAAVVHRDGLSAGQANIELEIPEPPSLVAPADEDVIDAESIFSWTGDQDTYLFHAEAYEGAYAGLYIVTARKQITLPTFSNGFGLAANLVHWWRVETHGSAQSVDELAGPDGFADSYGESKGEGPNGPRSGTSGSFTITSSRYFTVAP